MYIRELIIEEFSGKINEKITLENGFNLIMGANETGKSTVCAFIKFIFYGFADSKERDRYASIKTGNSSGFMIIEHEGKIYRIVRRASGRIQSVAVYDEENGAEFAKWRVNCDSPGEFFLGIPHSLYTRSIYVSQIGGPQLDSSSAEAISNLLLTGDQSLNLKRAKRTLEEARKTLKLKRGTGGAIYECQAKIDNLSREKEEAISIKKELEVAYAALAREDAGIEQLSAKINDAKKALELAKSRKIRAYLSRLDAAEKKIEATEQLEKELCDSNTYNGFLPDGSYEKKLNELSGQIRIYEKEINELKIKLTELQSRQDATPPREYSKYCALGKSRSLLGNYQKQSSRLRISHMAFLTSIFLAAICLISTLLGAFGIFKPNPLIYVLLGLSAVSAIGFGFLQMLPKKALQKLNLEIGATPKRSLTDICADCEKYEAKIADGQIGFTAQSLSGALAKSDVLKKALGTELSLWNKPSAEVALNDYRAFVLKRDTLKQEKQRAENEISVLDAYLSVYTDEEIDAAERCDASEYTELDAASEEELSRLITLLDQARQRKNDLNVLIASKNAAKADIDEIEINIEKESALLSDLNMKLAAITLAQSKLDEAEINIRRTVSPYLAEHSSKTFSLITNGDYSALKLDGEMNLSYVESGSDALISSAYFSAGSADLAWLCLRLALHKRLSENVLIPIILDEALVYFDDVRLGGILALLSDMSKSGTQIIMLSASEREYQLIKDGANCLRLT